MSDQEHEGSITPPPELDYYGPDINDEIRDAEQVGKFSKFLFFTLLFRIFILLVIPDYHIPDFYCRSF